MLPLENILGQGNGEMKSRHRVCERGQTTAREQREDKKRTTPEHRVEGRATTQASLAWFVTPPLVTL